MPPVSVQQVTEPGTHAVVFGNEYSWMSAKVVHFRISAQIIIEESPEPEPESGR